MTLKYLYRIAFTLLWAAVMFSSCLKSSPQSQVELSADAQIYSFSMTSKKDTTRVLSQTVFTIDQVNKKIFNRDSLPYLFNIDSVKLSVGTKQSSRTAPRIMIKLIDKDSSYVWNGKDSVAFKRLKSVEMLSENGKNSRLYEFTANIHRQDPYILRWTDMIKNHLQAPVEGQKTVLHKAKFITYYKSGSDLKAFSTPIADGKTWTQENLAGLPATTKINSFFSATDGAVSTVYAQDTDNSIYKSTDGTTWSKINPQQTVRAIFGRLPLASGEFAILTAVDDGGTLKFATTKDFSAFALNNALPEGLPITDFSTVSMESSTSFSAKFIVLSGGKDKNGMPNNRLWTIQEKTGEIAHASWTLNIPQQSSQLFFYDNKIYLISFESGKNKLYYSDNHGVNWASVAANQAFPNNFLGRKQASVITDSDNFIWIFGGESGNKTQIIDVWRGRLNKLAK